MLGPLGRTWLVPHIKIEQLRQAFHDEAATAAAACSNVLSRTSRQKLYYWGQNDYMPKKLF